MYLKELHLKRTAISTRSGRRDYVFTGTASLEYTSLTKGKVCLSTEATNAIEKIALMDAKKQLKEALEKGDAED